MAGIVDSTGALQGLVHTPSPELIQAIVRAWRDPKYRSALLTYPDDAGWGNESSPDYQKTNAAFKAVGLEFNNPVVLTVEQYRRGYKKAQDEDTIFVLPDTPSGNNISEGEAETQMIVHVFGM